jgi:hypothetical protein
VNKEREHVDCSEAQRIACETRAGSMAPWVEFKLISSALYIQSEARPDIAFHLPLVTPMFLAMMFRYADGSFTIAVWYVGGVALLMIGSGIWSLVAPESFRVLYFNVLRKVHRITGHRSELPRTGWGWGSARSIRLSASLGIALAVGFMTWVVFFTAPGVAY